MKRRHDSNVPGSKFQMEKPIRMQVGNSLADVQKIADKSREGDISRTVSQQASQIGTREKWLREERFAFRSHAQIVNGDKIGVAKTSPLLSGLKKPLIVTRAIRLIDNNIPFQDPVKSKPTTMRPIDPQLILQLVPLLK